MQYFVHLANEIINDSLWATWSSHFYGKDKKLLFWRVLHKGFWPSRVTNTVAGSFIQGFEENNAEHLLGTGIIKL